MIDKELFTNFYNELYENILDEYYNEINYNIKKNKISLIISCIIFAIIPTIIFWILNINNDHFSSFIIITIIYNIAVILFVFVSHRDNNTTTLNKIKYKVLDDIITIITKYEESEVLPNNRISQTSFEKTNFFDLNKVNYTGCNYIQTKLDNIPIVLGDINIYTYIENTKQKYQYVGNKKIKKTYKTKTKKDIFSGCYIGSNMNKKNDCLIQIIPDNFKNNILNNKINKYYNLCPYELKLENLEFNKNYNIYSNDEIKARMILTLTMMEQINDLEKIIDNPKYIFFKNDGRYSILIEDFTFEKLLNKNLNLPRNKEKELEQIYNLYSEIEKLFKIITIINKK